jgi:hypothetical protein
VTSSSTAVAEMTLTFGSPVGATAPAAQAFITRRQERRNADGS